MATQTQTQRKVTAQKAAATRRRNAAKRSRSAKKAAETRAQAELNTLQVVQLQAERAALVPVGAALTARDAVVDVVKPFVAGRESAEKELEKVGKRVQVNLKRFERRGSTARNRAVREVKRTRTRVERELRQRRTKAVRTVKQNRREAERQVKTTRREFERQASGIVQRVVVARVALGKRRASPGAQPRRSRRLTYPRSPGESGRGETAGQIFAGSVQYLSSLTSAVPFGAALVLSEPALLNWTRMPTREQIEDALRGVIDPELRKDIVTLGMVRSIEQPDEGTVNVIVSLTTAGCPIRNHFQTAVVEKVQALGVPQVNVGLRRSVRLGEADARAAPRPQRRPAAGRAGRRQERDLCRLGQGRRGQVHRDHQPRGGPPDRGQELPPHSTPTSGATRFRACSACTAARRSPPTARSSRSTGPAGVKAISIEFFLNERDQAITWRGPMLHKAIRQFLEDVDWGELDYLLIDLPPGTGDVSMTLAQLLPQAKFVIVTTPQPAAQKVAARAAETALRFDLEIAGVIENMSGFTTPSGERFTIFGEGGGQLLADELDVPLLGKIPLQEELEDQRRRGPAAGARGSERPRRTGDLPRGSRHHRRDAAAARSASGALRAADAGDHRHGTADGKRLGRPERARRSA